MRIKNLQFTGRQLKFLLIIFALLVGCTIKWFPYITHDYSFEVGFDTGIYEYLISKYGDSNAFPLQLMDYEKSLNTWMEPGFFIIIGGILNKFVNLPVPLLFRFYLPFIITMLFIVVTYTITKKITNNFNVAAFSCILISLSYLQYAAVNESFYKQLFGMFILLISLVQFDGFFQTKNKNYLYTLIILGSSLIAFHRPMTFLFGLIWVFYILKESYFKEWHTTKVLLLSGVCILVISSVIWIPQIPQNLHILSDILSESTTFSGYGGYSFLKFRPYGHPFVGYILNFPYIFIFGVFGLAYLIKKRKSTISSFLVLFLLLSIIELIRFPFYSRFLITFDILILILSSIGIFNLKSNRYFKVSVLSIVILIMVSNAYIYQSSKSPYISYSDEGIEWIFQNIDKNKSFIVAPDYISLSLKPRGYRTAYFEDTIVAPGSVAIGYVISQQILAEGDVQQVLELYYLHQVEDVYFIWGKWDESHPYPRTGKIISNSIFARNENLTEVYRGNAIISHIYSIKING